MERDLRLIKIALGVSFLTILSLLIVYLKPGLPAGHDIAAHAIRSKMMVEELTAGQFPVRWVDWVRNGESEPLFNFYQVGFYYLVSLLHLIMPLTEALKVAPLLIWWTGSAFMFLFMRRFGLLPAAFASLVYTFTPYIISDALVRAAYPELAAISFTVGVLWSLDRLVLTAKPLYGLALSLCIAAVFLFHLPTIVILFPIVLGYFLLLCIRREAQPQSFLSLIIGILVGIGLAGFYIIPALTEIHLIKSELLSADYYNFRQHFVYFGQLFQTSWGYGISKMGPDDGMSFQFGLLQWLILSLGLVSLWMKRYSKDRIFVVFWLLAITYSLFFMHDISVNFWENLRAISLVQYPWRYLMVVPLASACISALLIKNLNIRYQALTIFIAILSIIILYARFLTPLTYLPPTYFNIDTNEWRESQGVKENSYFETGYLPKNIEELPNAAIPKWTVLKGVGEIKEKTVKSSQLILVTNSDQDIVIRSNSHYFPGWKTYIDNLATNMDYSNSYGFMDVIVPSGIHVLEYKFTNTSIRSIANITTLISFTCLIIWQLYILRKRVCSFS